MKLPNLENFRLMPFTPPKGWEKSIPYQLVMQFEDSASTELQCGEAMVGAGVLKNAGLGHETEDGKYVAHVWVIRHPDFADGRANVEVQVRCIVGDTTYITALKDDAITEGKVVDFMETARHARLKDEFGNVWASQRCTRVMVDHMAYKYVNGGPNIIQGAALRAPMLFNQCMGLVSQIQQWLGENIRSLRTAPIKPEQALAMEQLFSAPPLALLEDRVHYRNLKKQALGKALAKDTFDSSEAHLLLRRIRRRLTRSNELSTPEMYAFHALLVRMYKATQETRSDPDKRLISVERLVGRHTRLINVLNQHLGAFQNFHTPADDDLNKVEEMDGLWSFLNDGAVNGPFTICWRAGATVEHWMQPLQGWGLTNKLAKGRFVDSKMTANRYDTLEKAREALQTALKDGGKYGGRIQILNVANQPVESEDVPQSNTGVFRPGNLSSK